MAIDDKTRDEKLQQDINREAAKNILFLILSSEVIDKYKYLNGEEILPSNQWQMIKQAKLGYSPLENNLKKQTEKQVGALNLLNPSNKKDKIKIFAKSVEWFHGWFQVKRDR